MPRKPADLRISIKRRGGKTHRIELIRQDFGERFWVATRLTQHVQRPVSAHLEQPWFRVFGELLVALAAELQERMLNHIGSGIMIAQHSRNITHQRPFALVQGGHHLLASLAFFAAYHGSFRK